MNPHSVPILLQPPPPLHPAADLPNLLQRLPQPHDRKPNHPRIQPQRLSYGVLSPCGAVEAHDEVVAAVVGGLVFAGPFGEQEGPPVGDVADYAARGED